MTSILRVRNEERWLEVCLRSVMPLVDRIVLFDDHSTDRTREIALDLGAEVIESPFAGLQEIRDKNHLLLKAAPKDGEWCLMIDGDESLHPDDHGIIQQNIAMPGQDCWSPRIVYLWDAPDRWRVDGVYGRFTRPSLFRYRHGLQFGGTGAANGFHCSNAPNALWRGAMKSQARLLHWGYMHKADRIRKMDWYRHKDPGNRAEDNYSHVCLGDLPELPATMKTKHAGPLEVVPL